LNSDDWIVNDISRVPFTTLAKDVWHSSRLVLLLARRTITVQSKQSFLGLVWPIVKPITASVLFLILFNKIAGIDSGERPYIVVAFIGASVWGYVSSATSQGVYSILNNRDVVSKTYFPRIVLPMASCLSAGFGLSIASVVLILLLVVYKTGTSAAMFSLPLWIGLLFLLVVGHTLLFSALHTRYRDAAPLTTYLSQIWMWISPVAYPTSVVPEKWLSLYYINPLSGIIAGLRWALLGGVLSWHFQTQIFPHTKSK